jgi:hypothetical protein
MGLHLGKAREPIARSRAAGSIREGAHNNRRVDHRGTALHVGCALQRATQPLRNPCAHQQRCPQRSQRPAAPEFRRSRVPRPPYNVTEADSLGAPSFIEGGGNSGFIIEY